DQDPTPLLRRTHLLPAVAEDIHPQSILGRVVGQHTYRAVCEQGTERSSLKPKRRSPEFGQRPLRSERQVAWFRPGGLRVPVRLDDQQRVGETVLDVLAAERLLALEDRARAGERLEARLPAAGQRKRLVEDLGHLHQQLSIMQAVPRLV